MGEKGHPVGCTADRWNQFHVKFHRSSACVQVRGGNVVTWAPRPTSISFDCPPGLKYCSFTPLTSYLSNRKCTGRKVSPMASDYHRTFLSSESHRFLFVAASTLEWQFYQPLVGLFSEKATGPFFLPSFLAPWIEDSTESCMVSSVMPVVTKVPATSFERFPPKKRFPSHIFCMALVQELHGMTTHIHVSVVCYLRQAVRIVLGFWFYCDS